jgi:hypothetical protein
VVSIEEMILVEDGCGIDRGLILVEDVVLAVGLGMEECAAWLTGLHGLGTDRSRDKSCKGGAYCGAASGSGSGTGGEDGNGTGAGREGWRRGAGRVVGILGETCDCT